MPVSLGPINSGLPSNIVSQIMESERAPLKTIETNKEKVGDKQALLNHLIQLTSALRQNVTSNVNVRSLKELEVVSDAEGIEVSVDKYNARTGTYQLQVESLARPSTAITNGIADKDKPLGSGYIVFTRNNGKEDYLFIDKDHSSLESIAGLINDDKTSDLTASVMNNGDKHNPWYLLLKINKHADEVRFPRIDLQRALMIEQRITGSDAIISVDGLKVRSMSNKFENLLPGITLGINDLKIGDQFNLTVTEDNRAVATKVVEVVNGLNQILGFIKEQNNMDAYTDTSRTLGGDSVLRSFEGMLKDAVFYNVNTGSSKRRMGDIGISFNREGLLVADEAKLLAELESDSKTVMTILAGRVNEAGIQEFGFLNKLQDVLDSALRPPTGLLAARRTTFQNNITDYNEQLAKRERTIQDKEAALKARFAKLEESITRMRGSGFSGPPAGPVLGG